MIYPSTRYSPGKEPVMVCDELADEKLGPGWFKSPADYGVETCPGMKPDPEILAKKPAAESGKAPRAPKVKP